MSGVDARFSYDLSITLTLTPVLALSKIQNVGHSAQSSLANPTNCVEKPLGRGRTGLRFSILG